MLIRLTLSPADEHRSGANQMRQHLSFREHFRRGNARGDQALAVIVAWTGGGGGGRRRWAGRRRRAAAASLAFERGTAAVAFDVHLEDGGVMDEAVDDSDRHCLVWEDLTPF